MMVLNNLFESFHLGEVVYHLLPAINLRIDLVKNSHRNLAKNIHYRTNDKIVSEQPEHTELRA